MNLTLHNPLLVFVCKFVVFQSNALKSQHLQQLNPSVESADIRVEDLVLHLQHFVLILVWILDNVLEDGDHFLEGVADEDLGCLDFQLRDQVQQVLPLLLQVL